MACRLLSFVVGLLDPGGLHGFLAIMVGMRSFDRRGP